MTYCLACGGEIAFTALENHTCPTPNPDYEKERDKYRQASVALRSRNELLGIGERPGPGDWVCLEISLNDGTVRKLVILQDNFSVTGSRLLIQPRTSADWTERIFLSSMRGYRFRGFTSEEEARDFVERGE